MTWSISLSGFGWHVVGTAVFFVSVGGALGMVGGIFHAFDGGAFECLIGLSPVFRVNS